MRPAILINFMINPDRSTALAQVRYSDAVAAAGGLPLVLTACTDPACIADALALVRGVVLVGGPDYHPDAYGGRPQPVEELMPRRRHDADLLLVRAVLGTDLPVLGVCGGMQLLAIASGAVLIQDIPSEVPGAGIHAHRGEPAPEHGIRTVADTHLRSLLGPDLVVNSYHHQAIQPQRSGSLRIAAHADDGIVEAIEDPRHRFRIGVQWHPERMPDHPSTKALFAGLVNAAA